MDIWKILGITKTEDETEIKRAYREQLKHNHPEVNPEGFKQLKQAYDLALKSRNAETITQAFPTREKSDTPLSVYKATFDERISDPKVRFDIVGWKKWSEKLALLDLSSQIKISDHALDKIMKRRWFPGELIHCFWQMFNWQRLMKGSEYDQEVADFLVYWGGVQTQIPLEALSEYCATQQRAIMMRIGPLSFSTTYQNIDDFMQWWHTPMPSSEVFHPSQYLLFLKGCQLQGWWPKTVVPEVVEQLNKLHFSALNCDEWLLVANACKEFAMEDLFVQSLNNVLQVNQSSFGFVAEVLSDWFKGQQQDVSMAMAVVAAEILQKPKVRWLFPTPWDKEKSKDHARYEFFVDTLSNDKPFAKTMRPLKHGEINDLSDEVYLTLWCGCYGSANDFQQTSARVSKQQRGGDFGLMFQVLGMWLQHKSSELDYPEWLKSSLSLYGNHDWFDIPDLTEEQVSELGSEQWQNLYFRHPLLPDQWFKLLVRKEILTRKLFVRQSRVNWLSSIGFYRVVCPDYQLLSPLGGLRFANDIEWLLHYYHLSPTLQNYSVPLPSTSLDTVGECAITAAKAFLFDPANEHLDEFVDIEKYSDQFILKKLIERRIEHISQNVDYQELAMQSLSSGMHLAAFSRYLIREGQLEGAAACLAILEARLEDWAYLDLYVDVLKLCLEQELDERKIEYIEFRYDDETYLYAVCCACFEEPTGANRFMAKTIPRDSYEVGINYVITLIKTKLDKHNFDKSYIEQLVSKDQISAEQSTIAEIALYHLNSTMQTKLEEDIEQKGKKAKSHNAGIYNKLAFLNIALYVVCRDHLIGLSEIFSTQNTVNISTSISLYAFSLLLFFATYARTTSKINRDVVRLIYPIFYVCTLLFGSFWVGIIQGLVLLIFTYGITKFNLNGKWESSTFHRREVPLFEQIYERKPEPELFRLDADNEMSA